MSGTSTTTTTTTTADSEATTAASDPSVSASAATTGAMTTSGDETMGVILDVGQEDTDIGPESGCREIDVLFVLDSSDSMGDERDALAATNAFTQIIGTLEGLNGGGIKYRVGLTDDNDHGFFTPPGWAFDSPPWFDSEELEPETLVLAFNGAVEQVGALGGPPAGCEHVLTSAITLLATDTSGFVRDEALLVLVLLSDVDDYGEYDQPSGNICNAGCLTPPSDLDAIRTTLLDVVKDGVPDSVAAIVLAGDPTADAGVNFCEQPGSCGCDGIDCQVYLGTRLFQFADDIGDNGVAVDLCGANVPNVVDSVLNNDIDLACQDFEPEG